MRFLAPVAVALTLASSATAAPIGVAGDALDRAVLVVEPSVYEIEAVFAPGGERRLKQGLAFAVSTTGHLLAAKHVIESDGRRALRIVTRRSGTSLKWNARVVEVAINNDIALLQIDDRGAPGLLLDTEIGGTVAAFGLADDAFVVRDGAVGSTEPVGPPVDDVVTHIEIGVRRGDSGGPVIGKNGRVQGMVLGFDASGDGFMKSAPDLQSFLRNAGVKNAEGAPAVAFRRGVSALGRLDANGAQAWFREVRATSPNHPTVQAALADANRLASAGFRVEGAPRGQGLLAMAAVIFGVVALCCGGALVSRRSRRYGGVT